MVTSESPNEKHLISVLNLSSHREENTRSECTYLIPHENATFFLHFEPPVLNVLTTGRRANIKISVLPPNVNGKALL